MLTVQDLMERRLRRANINHDTYKELYAKCSAKVSKTAEVRGTSTWWFVPPFVPGRPVYTHAHAIRYNVDKLKHGGFKVRDIGGGWLYIDWRRRQREQRQQRQQQRQQRPSSASKDAEEPFAARLERLQRKLKMKI